MDLIELTNRLPKYGSTPFDTFKLLTGVPLTQERMQEADMIVIQTMERGDPPSAIFLVGLLAGMIYTKEKENGA